MNLAVIFAGGVGSRMHSRDVPKQFLRVYDKPIIIHTLEHFEHHKLIDGIVVVCVKEWIDYLNNLLEKYGFKKVIKVVAGGTTSQLSIYNGLLAAEEICNGEKTVVLLHDGVRPLINQKLITENIADVQKYGSSITAGIVKETIVEINGSGLIKNVPDRSLSRVAKAPQCFWLSDILSVHRKALSEGKDSFIDSCTMMNRYGFSLHMTDGPYENFKITTPEDFFSMKAIFDARENAQLFEV